MSKSDTKTKGGDQRINNLIYDDVINYESKDGNQGRNDPKKAAQETPKEYNQTYCSDQSGQITTTSR